ncbi:hypothetical protein [Peribacillus asahii]|uniref:hypothetical protein n=1 Tax=Peribacillus asahii TaxID=228899 RepID=UPI002079AAC9|nr:hypothetical protein [Peribacillus asahii]USK60021.1 hypothetical protein LIT37_00895 [Peribacillus asahii]
MSEWKQEEFFDNLPPQFGDKLDLFGAMIVSLGNIITVTGIMLGLEEVEEIEEEIGEDGEILNQGVQRKSTANGNSKANSNSKANGNSDSELDLVIAFALIGAILITIGDLISAAGVAIEIEHAIFEEERVKQQQIEQDKLIKDMQNEINTLKREMKSLLRTASALEKEVVFLQRAVYVSYLK